METKVCSKCNKAKTIDNFRVKKSGYVFTVCKECEYKDNMDRYYKRKNPDFVYTENMKLKKENDKLEENGFRKCTACKEVKKLEEFYFRKDSNSYRNICKECSCKNAKTYREKNSDKIKEHSKKYYEDNMDDIKQRNKEYRQNNPEKVKEAKEKYYQNYGDIIKAKSRERYKKTAEKQIEYQKEYRKNNAEKIQEARKKYYEENKESLKKISKEYREKNKEKIEKYYQKNKKKISNRKNEYTKRRKKEDYVYKLKIQTRTMLNDAFRRREYKKSESLKKITGLAVDDLIKYLLKTFKENYGYEWEGQESVHIDHIIPLSTAKTEEDVRRLCHYTNLQLLKAKDNFEKKDRLDWKKQLIK